MFLCKRHLPVLVKHSPLQGIHQVLRYTGKARVFDRELSSAEEIESYWETAATPIWEVRLKRAIQCRSVKSNCRAKNERNVKVQSTVA